MGMINDVLKQMGKKPYTKFDDAIGIMNIIDRNHDGKLNVSEVEFLI